ncbi:MAG: transcription elongation factor GreA [Atopobiaceae bacterium]|nr:transcription elongation factor GreA [Atopobiaceae bacterium]MBR3314237.1 transcription elongation factor GreA [Atopobiaceae bacterium]
MATNNTILTPEGYAKLEQELRDLEQQKLDIADQLRVAREFGDLSENAEYDAAREAQAQNEARINEVRHILNTAQVADNEVVGERGTMVSVGSTVELVGADGKSVKFTIVGTTETNSLAHRISNESPAGAALVGHVVGDQIAFSTPSGKQRTFTIKAITR